MTVGTYVKPLDDNFEKLGCPGWGGFGSICGLWDHLYSG